MSESNVKMLVCDDSILARKSMTAMLNSFGYENVFEVSNGEDAVNKYKAEKPDIVFLDIVMPVKDGITATKEIIEFDPDAKIIVISSGFTSSPKTSSLTDGKQSAARMISLVPCATAVSLSYAVT